MRNLWLVIIPILLILLYLAGSYPEKPVLSKKLPEVPASPQALEEYIRLNESRHTLKPDNEARIIWAKDTKEKTAYSIVYLHGFSASQGEGDPVHRDIARKFGCNLYLSRLAGHGIDTVDALMNFTVDDYWESAKEALQIGKQIGRKVIIMGTSTGGTLALMLAAEYPGIHALVLLSPNIEISDPNSWILNNHWGLQIARGILHSNYIESNDKRDSYRQYWYYKYRIEGAVQLEELLETAMKKTTFAKIEQPVLTLYYYRDKVHQDSVVSVEAMQQMMNELATPDSLKLITDLPKAGNHVLGSYIKSKDIEGVETQVSLFFTNILHLKKAY